MDPMDHQNLFSGPHAHCRPECRDAAAQLAAGTDPYDVAAEHPAFLAAWGALADLAMEKGEAVTSYAFARTGYHRGLDQLRRAGWKGHGPIPWEHEPNQGFLRALHMLAVAAASIGGNAEPGRCREFLRDSSPTAAAALETT